MAKNLLTAAEVRAAAPKEKMYRLRDGEGLFLQVESTGRRWWAFRYNLAGKQKSLSCGVFPTVTLGKARDDAETMRKQLAEGIDPAEIRKTRMEEVETLADVVMEWHGKFAPSWAPKYAALVARYFNQHILPHLGNRPMQEITAPQLLAVLRRVEHANKVETARRLRSVCGQVWRYAIATGRAERDVAADLRGALPPAPHKGMAVITDPARIGVLLRDLDSYQGEFTTCCCLRLAPLCLLRPGELRNGRWSEIDLDAAEWRIGIERMKARQTAKIARAGEVVHVVPLPHQAVEILRQLHQVTGHTELLFPGVYRTRPIAEQTLLAALRRLGYAGGEQSMHGFRAMASTLLHEMGFNSDLIEKQLGHADRNQIRARYNHADYLPERRQMLQRWADYLDQLRAGNGGKVVPIKRASGG